jgi:adenine nucleotide transporter 17
MLQSLTVAALSGCVNVLLTNPIWVIVTRMQTHRKANKQQSPLDLTCVLDKALQAPAVENIPHKTIHVIQDLYKEAGFLGFWKGVVPALIMVSLMSHFLLLSYFFFTSYCFHVSSVIRLATLQSNSCCTRLF